MSEIAQAQRQGFEERMARIRAGTGPNLMGQVHVGPREEVRAGDPKAAKAAKKHAKMSMRRKSGPSALGTVMALPFAALVGAIAFFAGRIGTFHFFSGQGLYTIDASALPVDLALWGDVALGAVVALILGWSFHFLSGVRFLALLLGFTAGMAGELRLYETYPDVMGIFYPQSYAAEMTRVPPDLF